MLCDLHCHSSGISTCCAIPYEAAIDTAKSAGFDAIVLTNHYCDDYTKDLGFSAWLEKYIEEYRLAEEYGKSVDFKVFFGVEVTMNFDKRVHMLVYGITPKQLRDNPKLYEKSLEELYAFCKENDLTLVQAHPFRGGTTVLNTDYLDGIEINCHPKYSSTYSEKIIEIAQKNNLCVTCGCDYHGDVPYRPQGGVFLPDTIKTDRDLAKYLKQALEFRLQIHELFALKPNVKRITRTPSKAK